MTAFNCEEYRVAAKVAHYEGCHTWAKEWEDKADRMEQALKDQELVKEMYKIFITTPGGGTMGMRTVLDSLREKGWTSNG